ncbi:Fibrinogen-like protein 1 [Holothuria leucospilota]|uniref:Fibrinogen-like protein 1 n=1 Tax=Holothuria leucospilota TaxID=206669 RepID=A0A9Q1H5J6_HOLLE|nr:Fibrinogen-like protein 1 [Holothuria leucospilota]
MMYMECSCQVTCEDPDGTSGCHNNCTRGKTCICPDGYFLQGEHCVPPEECGCFVHGIGVIREGEFYVPTPNCSHICHCNSGIFHCTSYNCHNDEICEIRNDKLKCFCEYGYHSDGQSCIRSTDCMDLYKDGYIQDGAYTISPHGWTFSPFEVYCERGWTVFQRRYDGSVNFDRSWNDYKEGFGSPDHEMWLGNEKLFFITNQRDYELQIDLVINNGTSRYLKYENFRISDEENKYRILFLGGYSGDTGPFLYFISTGYNYMRYHKQQQFTTRDRDYDDHNQDNCAVRHHGGWWYSKCYEINLNGDYGNYTDVGICLTKKSTGTVELQCYVSFTQMKLRPEEYPRC